MNQATPALWDDVITKWFRRQYPSREHRRALGVEEAFATGFKLGYVLGNTAAKRAHEAQEKGIIE